MILNFLKMLAVLLAYYLGTRFLMPDRGGGYGQTNLICLSIVATIFTCFSIIWFKWYKEFWNKKQSIAFILILLYCIFMTALVAGILNLFLLLAVSIIFLVIYFVLQILQIILWFKTSLRVNIDKIFNHVVCFLGTLLLISITVQHAVVIADIILHKFGLRLR